VVKTTLLEGSVQVTATSSHRNGLARTLQPGEQSIFDGIHLTQRTVNAGEFAAWKDGLFIFNNTDLLTIMRQLSRWYDVEFVYSQLPDERFYAEIPRNTKLSEVLYTLQGTSYLTFKIEGRRVMV